MTSLRVVEWTCDFCHEVERTSGTHLGAPDGWIGLAVNLEAADGSWDSEWHRFHVCRSCRPEAGSELHDAWIARGLTWPFPTEDRSEGDLSDGGAE